MSSLRAMITSVSTGFILAGCALARVGPADPPQTYDLVSSGYVTETSARKPRGLQIVVNEPVALRSLAGDRIAIRPTPSEIQYFPKATWSDQLPRLVQARMIEALGGTGKFAAVAGNRERLDADLAVATDIRGFHVQLEHRVPVAHVDLYVRLIDQRRARVIVSRRFTDKTPAGNDDAMSGVRALNASMQALLPRVAAWAGRIRIAKPRQQQRPKRVRELDNSSPRTREPDLPLRDTQTDERETDPDARPPISPDLLIGRRKGNDRL